MGPLLSSRLTQSILKVLIIDRVVFWTDPENVRHWVRKQCSDFKPSVANWIGDIQQVTSPERWIHVPGPMDPVDLPTRLRFNCFRTHPLADRGWT